MSKNSSKIWFAVIFLNVFLLGNAHSTERVCKHEAHPAPPKKISIGVYPQKISDIDVTSKSFNLTYYITYQYPAPQTNPTSCIGHYKSLPEWVWNPRLEIMNEARTDVQSHYNIELDGDTVFVNWKATTKLTGTFDFTLFPFDRQEFSIKIMAFHPSNITALALKDDENSEDMKNIIVESWTPVSIKQTKMQETWDGLLYDHLTFSIIMDRATLSYVFRVILPIFIITCAGLLSLMLPLKNEYVEPRFMLQMSSMIALVAFTIVLDSKIPEISYLTVVDFITILAFICIFSSLVFTLLLIRKNNR